MIEYETVGQRMGSRGSIGEDQGKKTKLGVTYRNREQPTPGNKEIRHSSIAEDLPATRTTFVWCPTPPSTTPPCKPNLK